MINPYMQNAGAGGSPNQMNVGMAGVAEGAPMFGSMGAMGSQMQQPMFGNSSMNRSPLGDMGEQRYGSGVDVLGDRIYPVPGYYGIPGTEHQQHGPYYRGPRPEGAPPDSPRPLYRRVGPGMQPVDPVHFNQPKPNEFRLPDPFYQKPHLLEDPQYAPLVPFLDKLTPDRLGDKEYLFQERLPKPFTGGTLGSGVEEDFTLGLDYADIFGIDLPPSIKGLVGWLDTEHGAMFMDLYQQALDEK